MNNLASDRWPQMNSRVGIVYQKEKFTMKEWYKNLPFTKLTLGAEVAFLMVVAYVAGTISGEVVINVLSVITPALLLAVFVWITGKAFMMLTYKGDFATWVLFILCCALTVIGTFVYLYNVHTVTSSFMVITAFMLPILYHLMDLEEGAKVSEEREESSTDSMRRIN